ncbi:ATP-binding protein [Streptomyces sp. NBC_01236]|uniref:ATP-binding protein n=1 Tax=Streptomyces sp. NBC_01236 TaxID=2903789 RepID=UPI002E161C79|nr:ATP-binding protein [Streptomyces sp. NBC_01236]
MRRPHPHRRTRPGHGPRRPAPARTRHRYPPGQRSAPPSRPGPAARRDPRPRPRLSVSDEGPAFPPDFLPHTFGCFSRAGAGRTTPGTGLGLALVAAFAAFHDGTARAENTPPGTTVSLDIVC